jgi:hypothetical protein
MSTSHVATVNVAGAVLPQPAIAANTTTAHPIAIERRRMQGSIRYLLQITNHYALLRAKIFARPTSLTAIHEVLQGRRAQNVYRRFARP